MTEMTAYEHGVPCWIDLMSPDRAVSTRFYESLFDWQAGEPGGPESGFYTQFTKRGLTVAGLGQQNAEMAGMPAMWTTYLAADDVAETAAKVAEAGGTLIMPVMDVFEFGKMAILMDPSGAVVGLWQGLSHIGAQLVNEPGTMCWNELATRDLDAAESFFGELLGWTYNTSDEGYHQIVVGGREVGGLMAMLPEMYPAEVPAHWMPYFSVADADASATSATALGATVVVPPFDLPVGRVAIISDPLGAMFSIIQMDPAIVT